MLIFCSRRPHPDSELELLGSWFRFQILHHDADEACFAYVVLMRMTPTKRVSPGKCAPLRPAGPRASMPRFRCQQ